MTTLDDHGETVLIDLRSTLEEGAKDIVAGFTDLTTEQVLTVRRTLKRAIELQLSRVSVASPTDLAAISAELAALKGTLASLGEVRAVEVARRIDRFVTAVLSRLIDAMTGGLLPTPEGRG